MKLIGNCSIYVAKVRKNKRNKDNLRLTILLYVFMLYVTYIICSILL